MTSLSFGIDGSKITNFEIKLITKQGEFFKQTQVTDLKFGNEHRLETNL